MGTLPRWMTVDAPENGRVVLNPNGARPPLVTLMPPRTRPGVTLVKTTDAPVFKRVAPGRVASLGWVGGYPVKALAEIQHGTDAGSLAVIVHRPDHVDPYGVIITPYTLVCGPTGSHVPGSRTVDTSHVWDRATSLIQELSR